MRLLSLGYLVLAALSAAAQGPPRPEAQIAAMAKLDYMTGTWKGAGWMDFGGRRADFQGSEVVQSKLNGTVLQVEGSFFARRGEAEIPVHTTLGVISYDPQKKAYRFTTWLATGGSGERELVVKDRGWSWEIHNERGIVRYEMELTEDGEWLETGVRSKDGQEWQKFFEMRLRKE